MPRTTRNKEQETISSNDHFNIIEILLLDHSYLKDCIDILRDRDEEKKIKLKFAKGFLDALKKHSAGEKKALYAPLEKVNEFRSHILESQIEHAIIDAKVRKLSANLSGIKSLSDEMEAELNVLADLVEHHLEEEEDELFPKMRKEIDTEILNQMGYQFMVLRQFTDKDLIDNPDLLDEMANVGRSVVPIQSLMNVTNEYFGRHGHR